MVRFGEYEIIKEIALDDNGKPTGGFGRIYQARHVVLGKKAALKQNKLAGREHPEYMDLLKHEAEMLWDLDEHHSIPNVKGFFQINDDYWAMAMRFIDDGATLEQIVSKNGRLHPEDASWITERLLDALRFCHHYGVIHSDIKPGNVFVEPAKRDIKLIDFGLASFRPTAGSKPLGFTEAYMAPEVLLKKPPIPETDIFGAGMVMLYALGGNVERKAFPSDTPDKIVGYCSRLLRYNPMERPNWDKEDLVKSLSDVRHEVFGRRHVG